MEDNVSLGISFNIYIQHKPRNCSQFAEFLCCLHHAQNYFDLNTEQPKTLNTYLLCEVTIITLVIAFSLFLQTVLPSICNSQSTAFPKEKSFQICISLCTGGCKGNKANPVSIQIFNSFSYCAENSHVPLNRVSPCLFFTA